MPRLIRRRPLAERIKSYLNPLDFLLWLSEELDSSDWDQWQRDWAVPIGFGANVVFLIARANSGGGSGRGGGDDVFGDDVGGVGWLSWFVSALQLSGRPREYKVLRTDLGVFHRTSLVPHLVPQCPLHLPTEKALPALRSLRRLASKHVFCAPRPSRLLASVIITSTVSLKHAGIHLGRSQIPPGRRKGRVGNCSLGSHPPLSEAILPLQPGPCSRILAFSPYSST